MTKENFILSYSGGKDCLLAYYRAVKSGGNPLGAITTFDRENECSWYHHLPESILKRAEQSLGFPIRIVDTKGDRYADDFEAALKNFESQGVKSVVFGDIDIQEHYDWCDARCRNVGMQSVFPLWKGNRRKIVEELIDAGFRALITTLDATRMDEKFLEKILTREIISQMAAAGVDPCGENGEYHTFVYDGPLFRNEIELKFGHPIRSGNHICLPIY